MERQTLEDIQRQLGNPPPPKKEDWFKDLKDYSIKGHLEREVK